MHSLSIVCILGTILSVLAQVDLKFREDGTFRIVQFTDLHYGESAEKDANSSIVQTTILQAENPDLVIMTGDCVSGYAWNHSQGWFEDRWKQLIQPMINSNVKWAVALGNHDDEADLNRDQIVDLDQKNTLSLTQKGPQYINGVTNYVLPIYSSNIDNVIANLWFFDSGDDNCLGVPGWDCIYPSQVQWYRETSTSFIQKFGIIPGLSFFHIPIPEFMNVWNYETTYGRLEDEGVCCSSVNTGLFAAMREMGDMRTVHCGHDHDNDFYGAYGRKTGYGAYGPPPGWLRGARVIELTQNPFTITSWIRQEDGSKVTIQPTHAPGTNQTFLCCDAVAAAPKSNCRKYEEQFRKGLVL